LPQVTRNIRQGERWGFEKKMTFRQVTKVKRKNFAVRSSIAEKKKRKKGKWGLKKDRLQLDNPEA
jgi:hypothetical protein